MPKLPPHIVWPGAVVALLLMSLTMGTITIIAATGDPSFAIEANHYEKGLNWDDHLARQEASQRLGWRAEIEVGEPDTLNRRPLLITLTDAEGNPIKDAAIEAECFHHAAANRIQALTLTPGAAPGQYRADTDINRPGLWDLALAVSARGEVFTDRRTLTLRFD